MHFQGLNLNLLVSLDAILSEKSVTRAAERLNVTQPAMSVALRKLREHLSDPILERIGQQFELTPRAREIAGSVRELLFQINNLLNTAAVFDPQSASRVFRVSMSGYMAELIGVPMIRYLQDNAPNISFQIVDLCTESLRQVEEGELDYCITVLEHGLSDPSHGPSSLSEHHLFSDQFVLVAAEGNAAVTNRLNYKSFCSLPYIEVRFSGSQKSVPDLVLDRQQERPKTLAWMPTSQNVLSAVSATSAVAIVPSRLFELQRSQLRLKSVKPPLPLPSINQKCFWHSRSDNDLGHRWFGDALKAIASAPFPFNQPMAPRGIVQN